jgi:hypothetical protein
MNEKKILRELSELLNTNSENIPNVLTRIKKEVEDLEKELSSR